MSARMLSQKDTPFEIYESVSYVGRPFNIGMRRATILYENMLYRNGETHDTPPNADSLNYWVNLLSTINLSGALILDLEHWPIYTDSQKRQYMVDVLEAFKVPGRLYQVGYYAMVPQRDTFAALLPWHPSFQLWQGRNTAVQSIATASDVLYPSLYTVYADEHRWTQYAVQNILEARRLAPGKKIIPMLWPQYHEVSDRKALQYIDPDFWLHQLTTIYRMCDGVVIWKIADGQKWDTMLPWYQATKEFMERFQS